MEDRSGGWKHLGAPKSMDRSSQPIQYTQGIKEVREIRGNAWSSTLDATHACPLHAMEVYQGPPWRASLSIHASILCSACLAPGLRYPPRSSFMTMLGSHDARVHERLHVLTVGSCRPGSHDDLINMSQLPDWQPSQRNSWIVMHPDLCSSLFFLIYFFCMCI